MGYRGQESGQEDKIEVARGCDREHSIQESIL